MRWGGIGVGVHEQTSVVLGERVRRGYSFYGISAEIKIILIFIFIIGQVLLKKGLTARQTGSVMEFIVWVHHHGLSWQQEG